MAKRSADLVARTQAISIWANDATPLGHTPFSHVLRIYNNINHAMDGLVPVYMYVYPRSFSLSQKLRKIPKNEIINRNRHKI